MRTGQSMREGRPFRDHRHRGRHALGVAALAASILVAPTAAAQESTPTEAARSSHAPAFWAGTRAGLFVPYGGLYSDQSLVTTPFQDVATAGPSLEIDCGARLAEKFIGYAFFDHAFLGRGNSAAWTTPHGGQRSASTQAFGLGARWESNPQRVGIVADVAVGYRWFMASWENATNLRMGGFGDLRVGLGATFRAAPTFMLTPMISVLTGAFTSRSLNGEPLGSDMSTYVASALTVSAHFDVF